MSVTFTDVFGSPDTSRGESAPLQYVFTESGRSAERLFFQNVRARKTKVLQNLLFDTTLHNEIKAKFEPIEIPDPDIFDPASTKVFRGGLDLARLESQLSTNADDIGMILLELCNNASGGYPASLAHIEAVHALARRHQIPLVMDITRILRNSELIRRHEGRHEGRDDSDSPAGDLYTIVAQTLSHADGVIGSLSKDFALNHGGLIGSRDAGEIQRIGRLGAAEGGLSGPSDRKMILAALADRDRLERMVGTQLDITRRIHAELSRRAVPAVQPGVGHCVLVRVNEVARFRDRKHPKESFLKALHEEWGIRAGIHLVGNQNGTTLNDCIRLAIPLGLNDENTVSYLCTALEAVVKGSPPGKRPLPGIAPAAAPEVVPRRAQVRQAESSDRVAIIGLSGHYPQAANVEALWENLKSGARSIVEVPGDRWQAADFHHPDPAQAVALKKSYAKWGGFLQDHLRFDGDFFAVPPGEVPYIDPQERLFLQECWKALEDAGHRASELTDALKRRTAVYGGITKVGFNLYSVDRDSLYYGTSLSSMVSRVAFHLDLKGPCVAIDNDCASSLVAIHHACEYIRSGKGDLALAGGVNLNLHPSTYLYLCRMRLLAQSPDNAAFCKGGTGYVPGEGVGVVVLKNHEHAIRDGDHIYAVIRGSAINHNGRMTQFGRPNQHQQQAVIREALASGGIDPRTIGHVEAAAYGSELGDAIEVAALQAVFGDATGVQGTRSIGSIKPNIGHCEAASGISQLTKVILSLKYATLAPTLSSGEPNPSIDFERLPFRLQATAQAWERMSVDGETVPRRAGISAFGGSGINAHVVLEEHPTEATSPTQDGPQLFVLSARDATRLEDYADRWIRFLDRQPGFPSQDLAYTLQVGREAMNARLAIVFSGWHELQQALRQWHTSLQGDGSCCFMGSGPGKSSEPRKTLTADVGEAMARRDWQALARHWVQGASIPWPELHGGRAPHRIAGLPTYPFAAGHDPLAKAPAPAPARDVPDQASPLRGQMLRKLGALLADVMDVPGSTMHPDEPFERHGIDSLRIVALNAKLAAAFGDISKTLFFECRTLGTLTDHLLLHHREACAGWAGEPGREGPGEERRPPLPIAPPPERPVAVHRTPGTPVRHQASTDIAIIGVSGRYPGAQDLDEFWDNLRAGRDCIEEIPAERWSLEGFFNPDRKAAVAQGKSYSKWGGFLEGFSRFDPLLFNISPREALAMDPQERLFLQCCWEVFENAGYTRESLDAVDNRNVGVFVGVTHTEFGLFGPGLRQDGVPLHPYALLGSVANRVSYFFDLHGPSMPIDTMCSSSLTALHEACERLRHGACAMAIAGGVNVLMHPYAYVGLSAQQFLSSDGRCRSFGKNGNGFVPAEGVGAVLLKPLAAAIAAGDPIHGVIRATSVNHGGKTHGYTVPNPVLQGELVRESLRKAGVDARAVSYVEAHGTGTELGDPIEITGLTQAFRHDTRDTGFCAIGSVKSNIGHCESAAGIAGVTKVLLQMKHRTLVPSLHSEEHNPHIDFGQTPFVVNHSLREWPEPVIDGRRHPRMASVSSFGAGGSNAHALIEEYASGLPGDTREPMPQGRPALVVLSAQNADRLKAYAVKLLEWLRNNRLHGDSAPASPGNGSREIALHDLAYTLQVGREAMEERLGIIAATWDDLERILGEFAAGRGAVEGLHLGRSQNLKGTMSVFDAEEDLSSIVDRWIERGSWERLARLWVNGFRLDWHRLHGSARPTRISAPTYPFAQETYWFTATDAAQSHAAPSGGEVRPLHPLLHRNTSNFHGQSFESCLTGRESFLADHVVNGLKILPGVAYLEMARAAMAVSSDVSQGGQLAVCIRNVAWSSPIIVAQAPAVVRISLAPQQHGDVAFEVYQQHGDADARRVVNSKGVVSCVPRSEVPRMDLAALRTQCRLRVVPAQRCYETLAAMGLAYGAAHRGMVAVHVGEGQVLAQLSLPAALAGTLDRYVLHPSLLDSALQASVCLLSDAGDAPAKPLVPFALESIEVFGPCTAAMWAHVRYSSDGRPTDAVQKLDVDVADERGEVRARLKGFSARAMEGDASPSTGAQQGLLMLAPHWQAQAWPPADAPVEAVAGDHGSRIVLICEVEEHLAATIVRSLPGMRCRALISSAQRIDQRYEDFAVQVFEEVKRLAGDKPRDGVLVQLLVGATPAHLFNGLAGIFKAAHLENPMITGQVIEIDGDAAAEEIVARLTADSRRPAEALIRYDRHQRWVLREKEMPALATAPAPWKAGGVYLITGGAGGLGLILAREIAQQADGATLVLTGRSVLGEVQRERLAEIERITARVIYKPVDVTDRLAMQELVRAIEADQGRLDGVVHAAGIIRDNFILRKTAAEFREVLASKVTGLVNLDEACQHLPLDFFVVFSSLAGVIGNVGQSDYAAANAFMDRYVVHRHQQVEAGLRSGKTLSINWPLWQDGGMRVDADDERRIQKISGMVPLSTANGLSALCAGLQSDAAQIAVAQGDPGLLRRFLNFGNPVPHVKAGNTGTVPAVESDAVREQVLAWIKTLLSGQTGLAPERIQSEVAFEKYGVDSVTQMNVIDELEKVTGALPKTLLFEYSTSHELMEYLVERHAGSFGDAGALRGGKAAVPGETTASHGTGHLGDVHAAPTPVHTRFAESPADDAIAIVGISGRFPGSNSLDELWENLLGGKSCVTPYPQDRLRRARESFSKDGLVLADGQNFHGGFLDDVEQFDNRLFDIPDAQVVELAPELRLFLETVWETFENAGYARHRLNEIQAREDSGIGVFVGSMYSQYPWTLPSLEMAKLVSNGTDWNIANRTSHFFNLTGPSLAVNCACSSSLTAIHLACESLRQRSCSLAIAGGVNLTLDPSKYLALDRVKILERSDRSMSFGIGAGYVPGEGVGAVLLKPLSAALRDGDRVHAVIRSSFVNHGGGRQAYTAPDPKLQTQLIVNAIRRADIDAGTIGYVESAANGSLLGDSIEMAALKNAFVQCTDKRQFCALGSVKSNLGHLEAASGISQLSKVVLQLKHRTLVPTINARPANPNIHLEGSSFYLQETTEPWDAVPRRSLINSFGAGGSYASLLIEEHVPALAEMAPVAPVLLPEGALLVFSAKTQRSLMAYLRKMQAFLQKHPDVSIDGLRQSMFRINQNLDARAAFIARSAEELAAKLHTLLQTAASAPGTGIHFAASAGVPGAARTRQALADMAPGELAAAWVAGDPTDFMSLYGPLYGRTAAAWVDVPTYAFDHGDAADGGGASLGQERYRSLLEMLWKGEISTNDAMERVQP